MPDLNSLPPSTRSPPPPSSATSLPASSSSIAMSLSAPANDSDAASPRPHRHRQPSSPSPSLSPSRTAATSLQAAAAVNAGLHHGSRRVYNFLSPPMCVCVLSADPVLRLFRLALSTSHNLLKRRPSPIPSPNEPTTQRSCHSGARRDAPRKHHSSQQQHI